MNKYITLMVFVFIILGLFYLNERIVIVTKENPNETNSKLIGTGIAKAGIDAADTLVTIGKHLTSSTNNAKMTINNTITNNTLI